MKKNNFNRSFPYFFSISVHLLLAVLLYFVKVNINLDETEYIELGFGTFGKLSSSGAEAAPKEKIQEKKKEEPKKVELPKAKNLSENNPIVQKQKEKNEVQKEARQPSEEKDLFANSLDGEGEGWFGFNIDFGGKGKRKIYSYILPAYPDGVNKEADIKLRFTILPDGTVGSIFPIAKADSRLERAAINSLRQWRFEPLSPKQPQVEQTAIITFPYRLR
jgi:protein TonB